MRSLRELKVQLGDETQGATDAEHEALEDIFVCLARITSRLESSPDVTAVRRVEVEQARSIVMELRNVLQRRHLNLASPRWRAPMSRDANLVFFSGPPNVRRALTDVTHPLRVDLNPDSYAADAAGARWRDQRAAGSAIFDLTNLEPQVLYDLGVAITLGTHVILLAEEQTRLPFDVGQDAVRYASGSVAEVLPAALHHALYGTMLVTDPRSSVDSAIEYGRKLATEYGTELATTLFSELPAHGVDPIQANSLLRVLDAYVPSRHLDVLRSRWAASFPAGQRQCFVIMPFRVDLQPTWAAIQRAFGGRGIHLVRGDQATGQEIIASIWAEIGRSSEVIVDLTGFNPNVCLELGIADTLGIPSLLIGMAGTEAALADRWPSLAKRRCHPYMSTDDLTHPLARFLAGELTWA